MTVRLASATCGDTPIELRVEDRLQSLAIPIRGMSTAMIGILIGSIAVHVLLVATTLVSGWAPPPIAPREISVEIVQDPPKPPAPAAAPKREPAKLEKPHAEAAKIEAPKPPPAAPKPPPAAPRPETAAKPVAAKPIDPPAQPKPAATETAQDTKALEAELASLRAEQAALKASEAQETVDQNGAGQAIAMPSIGGDGDAVGYQQLVFSQLAKAKGDAEYHGKSGVAGIRFEMDQAGQLVRAEVVSPSGDPALDAKALDIVHRAAPFPPPPTEADRFVFANVNFIAPKSQ